MLGIAGRGACYCLRPASVRDGMWGRHNEMRGDVKCVGTKAAFSERDYTGSASTMFEVTG